MSRGGLLTVDEAVGILEGHEKAEIRGMAASWLASIAGETAVPVLIQALQEDENGLVRSKAAFALGKIKDAQAVPALIRALADDDVRTRRRAAYALGEIGDAQEAVDALIEVSERSCEDSRVRKNAIGALGYIGDPCAMPTITQALNDSERRVGEQAASALGDIGSSQAVDALVQALGEQSSPEIRRRCVLALGDIWMERARLAASSSTGGQDAWDNVKPVAKALVDAAQQDKSQSVRTAAKVQLIWGTRDDNPSVRQRALGHLAKVADDETTVSVLGEAAVRQDEEDFVKSWAVYELGELGGGGEWASVSVRYLSKALAEDGNYLTRLEAVYALGNIGTKDTVPVLIKALANDPRRSVQEAAGEALQSIGDVADLLIEAAHSEDKEVKRAARSILYWPQED